jgi:hypothetical protein
MRLRRSYRKESNHLEKVDEQGIYDACSVYTEYTDPRRDEWQSVVLPRLKAMPMRKLQELTGMSRAALYAIRGGRRPHAKNREALTSIIRSERAVPGAAVDPARESGSFGGSKQL